MNNSILKIVTSIFLCITLSSCSKGRNTYDKYVDELNRKITPELIRQGICNYPCDGLWFISPMENKLVVDIYIPQNKQFDYSKIINIFTEINIRDDLNITLSFYNREKKGVEKAQRKFKVTYNVY